MIYVAMGEHFQQSGKNLSTLICALRNLVQNIRIFPDMLVADVNPTGSPLATQPLGLTAMFCV